jgi:hypothetical protein
MRLDDLHVIVDVLVARLAWTAIAELAVKPIAYWKHDWLKANFPFLLHRLKL